MTEQLVKKNVNFVVNGSTDQQVSAHHCYNAGTNVLGCTIYQMDENLLFCTLQLPTALMSYFQTYQINGMNCFSKSIKVTSQVKSQGEGNEIHETYESVNELTL